MVVCLAHQTTSAFTVTYWRVINSGRNVAWSLTSQIAFWPMINYSVSPVLLTTTLIKLWINVLNSLMKLRCQTVKSIKVPILASCAPLDTTRKMAPVFKLQPQFQIAEWRMRGEYVFNAKMTSSEALIRNHVLPNPPSQTVKHIVGWPVEIVSPLLP